MARATAAASAVPAILAPPTNTNIKSANSTAASEAGTELVKLKNVLNDGNFFLKPIFEEYDAYRKFHRDGKKTAKPSTDHLDEARTKLKDINLQAAFKGLAMIAGKDYVRTTPGASFAAVGPMAAQQQKLVKVKNATVGRLARLLSRGSKGGRRSVTRRHRERR